MRLRVVLIASVGLLLVPPSALGAPPTLLSVGQTSRHLTATWSLPPGAESRVIEAATSPNTGSDGAFFTENVVLFDVLESPQTSYLSTSQVPPGLVYVHVSTDCPSCPSREYSNILTVTIPPDPAPPPPPDTTKPFTTVGGPFFQKIDKLYVSARLTEDGAVSARATVNVPGSSKVYRFKPVSKPAVANVAVKLRLKLANRARRFVKRALKRGRSLRVRVSITATDKASNSSVTKRTLFLKR